MIIHDSIPKLLRSPFLTLWLVLVFALTNNVVASDSQTTNQQADTDHRDTLFRTLAQAKTEAEGRHSEDAVWNYWFDQAPSAEVRAMLDAAIERREAYDFEAAENILDDVVEQAPDFAEGYNQRAFIRFLRENRSDSITDINKTLELEPKHFGALAGLYLILSWEGEQEKAYSALQEAVTIYPWLKERNALPESLWPESYKNIHAGQDI